MKTYEITWQHISGGSLRERTAIGIEHLLIELEDINQDRFINKNSITVNTIEN